MPLRPVQFAFAALGFRSVGLLLRFGAAVEGAVGGGLGLGGGSGLGFAGAVEVDGVGHGCGAYSLSSLAGRGLGRGGLRDLKRTRDCPSPSSPAATPSLSPEGEREGEGVRLGRRPTLESIRQRYTLTLAQAGVHLPTVSLESTCRSWVPAFAGIRDSVSMVVWELSRREG